MSKKRHKRILHWDDERDEGNGYLVSLEPGWKFDNDPLTPTHVMGFDTVAEAMTDVRSSLPCDCEGCQNELKERAIS